MRGKILPFCVGEGELQREQFAHRRFVAGTQRVGERLLRRADQRLFAGGRLRPGFGEHGEQQRRQPTGRAKSTVGPIASRAVRPPAFSLPHPNHGGPNDVVTVIRLSSKDAALRDAPSSGPRVQAQSARRGAAVSRRMPQGSSSAMPAMPPVMVSACATAAAHRGAAWRAQLRRFRLHAGRHLGHIRDGVAAQPHGIGRAGLTLRVGALRGGSCRHDK